MANNSQPLVSIISFCKDRAGTIRRSIDSVVTQSYRHLEFVVQDGVSTDGTLEILRGYDDPRIKIVSEPDSGPAEAFWRVMNRCEGDIIGTCLSDEELLPGAVERAVAFFHDNPDVGAMTCDGWVTDMDGKIINEFNAGEFNFIDYLFGKYCPFWPGTFFRRQALLDVGLKYHDWTIECLEFETWCRLATQHVVKHVPARMSKYAVHATQLSNTKQYFHEHFDNRTKVIRKLFSEGGFLGDDPVKLNACLYNQLFLLYNHVRAYRLADQEELLLNRIRELQGSIPVLERFRYKEYFNFLEGGGNNVLAGVVDESAIFRRISGMWLVLSLALPQGIKRRMPPRVKRAAQLAFWGISFYVLVAHKTLRYAWRNRRLIVKSVENALPLPLKFSPRLYHDAAMLYYARGQIDEALEMWRRAEPLMDSEIDGLACQAHLMSTTATYENLLTAQRQWADRHAKPIRDLPSFVPPPYDGVRRLRVGYFCSFMDGDTIRFIMLPVLINHDRNRVEIFGYSPMQVPSDIHAGFDHFKAVGAMSDRQFVETLRNDRLDILVELSGFSPRNRFSAIASRCATVQISYLNHTGTSAVPNVDYVLADETSVLPEHERFFTERVWRLPGCFLNYNYDAVEMWPISEVPSASRGHITFGYFGSGGKLGSKLIALWAQILNSVPNSMLFIRNMQLDSADNRQYMINRFRRNGVPEERLRLMGGADRQTIVKAYDEVDISLDTWPYCGGNTVAESLWQGVPVITLKSDRFSGRYGASLLAAAGCPELVAETKDEYVRLAVDLSQSPERLVHFRQNLRQMVKKFGLSDPKKFSEKLESAFIDMMKVRH